MWHMGHWGLYTSDCRKIRMGIILVVGALRYRGFFLLLFQRKGGQMVFCGRQRHVTSVGFLILFRSPKCMG